MTPDEDSGGEAHGGALTYIWLVGMCGLMDPVCEEVFPRNFRSIIQYGTLIEHFP